MKNLFQIRKAYDDNYAKMMSVIQEMGGDEYIKFHRKKRSTLYSKLRDLQRQEHHLDEMENRLCSSQCIVN